MNISYYTIEHTEAATCGDIFVILEVIFTIMSVVVIFFLLFMILYGIISLLTKPLKIKCEDNTIMMTALILSLTITGFMTYSSIKDTSKPTYLVIWYENPKEKSILKRKPSFIVIEDLNVKGLIKNKHLSKSIFQAQWYQSRIFLQQQCEKLGIELRLVSRFYPSSKLCSYCGYKKVDLKLNDRSWECPDCHTIHDRDQNAAINLERCTNYTVLATV